MPKRNANEMWESTVKFQDCSQKPTEEESAEEHRLRHQRRLYKSASIYCRGLASTTQRVELAKGLAQFTKDHPELGFEELDWIEVMAKMPDGEIGIKWDKSMQKLSAMYRKMATEAKYGTGCFENPDKKTKSSNKADSEKVAEPDEESDDYDQHIEADVFGGAY